VNFEVISMLFRTKGYFLSVYEAILSQLKESGRIETKTGAMLVKRKMFQAFVFTEIAQAFIICRLRRWSGGTGILVCMKVTEDTMEIRLSRTCCLQF